MAVIQFIFAIHSAFPRGAGERRAVGAGPRARPARHRLRARLRHRARPGRRGRRRRRGRHEALRLLAKFGLTLKWDGFCPKLSPDCPTQIQLKYNSCQNLTRRSVDFWFLGRFGSIFWIFCVGMLWVVHSSAKQSWSFRFRSQHVAPKYNICEKHRGENL